MRKTIEIILLVLTVVLFITAFASCARNEAKAKAAAATVFKKGFSCTADVNWNGNDYEVNFKKPTDGTCTMTIIKPAELANLSFKLTSEGLKIDFGEIEAEVSAASVPQTSLFNTFQNVFNKITQTQDIKASYSGSTLQLSGNSASGAFQLVLNPDLSLKSLEIPSQKLKATFSNYKNI